MPDIPLLQESGQTLLEEGGLLDLLIDRTSGAGSLPPADWFHGHAVEKMKFQGAQRRLERQREQRPAEPHNNKRVALLAWLMKEIGLW